jgi:hypothetical protein
MDKGVVVYSDLNELGSFSTGESANLGAGFMCQRRRKLDGLLPGRAES